MTLILAAALAERLQPEYAEVRAELEACGCDDESVLRHAEIAHWARRRVELEEWGDTPYSTPWVDAHLHAYEHAVECWIHGTERDRDFFHRESERTRLAWLDAHPEWGAARETVRAEREGRLF